MARPDGGSCPALRTRPKAPHYRTPARLWPRCPRQESLWQAGADSGGITSGTFYGTFYGRFRRYLREAGLSPTGLHILRHTAAKLRREAGESIEAVSSFLDHSSLAVTTVYLRRLEGQADETWAEVAAAIGV